MPYQRDAVVQALRPAAEPLDLVLETLRQIQRQLELLTLLQLGSSDAVMLLGASSQGLPNPASDARMQEIAHAVGGPLLVRVRAVGYQQGAIFISASGSGGADTANRSPDTISDGSAKTYYVPKSGKIFARAEKSGGQSSVWVTATPISEVYVQEKK